MDRDMLRVSGFFGHIQRNNFRSVVMFFGFVLACQLIGVAFLLGPLIIFDRANEPVSNFSGYITRYGLGVFAFSIMLFAARLFHHVQHVRQATNFNLVSRTEAPRLWKIVNIQAITAGIAMPDIGIMQDGGLNAFACGLSRNSAVIVVTSGLLNALDDDELEAVIAHEITHIANGDIRLMAVANVMLSTLMLISKINPLRMINIKYLLIFGGIVAAVWVWSNGLFSMFLLGMVGPVLLLLIQVFAILAIVSGFIASVATTIGKLSRLLIASSREFIADAEAVRMTKNPAALISALGQIEGHSSVRNIDAVFDAMMIDGPVEGMYASHPSIGERISALSRHSGAMVQSTGRRKDTRILANSTIGSLGTADCNIQLEAKTAMRPNKLLVDRVNVGSNENAFGLSPMMRNFAIVAIAGPFLVQFLLVSYFDRATGGGLAKLQNIQEIRSPLDPNYNGQTVIYRNPDGAPDPLVLRRKRARLLGRMDPLKARCFATKAYRSGDSGLYRFTIPDQNLIARYVRRDRNVPEMAVEKYAAIRLQSITKVNKAKNTDALDKSLLEYVDQRKSTLSIMHRIFGGRGYQWMRDAYNSRADQQIIGQLKTRLAAGARSSLNKPASKAGLWDALLLVDNPADFIPCYVRAGMDEPD